MRKLMISLGAIVLLSVPSGLDGQDLQTICNELQDVEAGEWAEWEMTSPQGSGTVRLAMLSEGAAGEEGTWMEMSGEFSGQSSIIQLLIEGYPYDPADVQAVVMKMGSQPAMKLPDSMLGQMRGQMNSPMGNIAEVCGKSELLGEESVTVPAGSFDTYHMRAAAEMAAELEGGEVWVSTEVPFGLVKSSGRQGSMVLLDSGDDATSSIEETPSEMPGMGAPGGP